MRFPLFLLLGLVPGLAVANASVPADSGATTGNPYIGIAGRNVFALVPIPTNVPVVEAPPKEPPPKITPNGIMDLFGQLQVLFKVAGKPAAGQPPKDKAYVLGQGERADDIEVIKINQTTGTITFRNHGELQELALAEAPKISTPAPAAAAGGNAPNAVPMPNSRAAAAAARFGLRQGAAAPGTATEKPSSNPSPVNAQGIYQPEKTELPYEVQVLNMESQRAKWLDEGNPAAAIMPPTEITHEVTGGGDGSGGPPALPVPPKRNPRR